MSYVILQVAQTIDSFIAREDGNIDFLGGMDTGFTENFNKFVDSIDVIVMGSGSYHKMLEFGEIPFKNKRIYVLTSKKLKTNEDHISFIEDDVKHIVEFEQGNIWLFGGANVIKQFIDQDLIDELQLYTVPKVIGKGIPLFLDNNGMENLHLVETKQYGDNVFSIYKKV